MPLKRTLLPALLLASAALPALAEAPSSCVGKIRMEPFALELPKPGEGPFG